MDTNYTASVFGAVPLEGTLATLARSKLVRTLLRQDFGSALDREAVAMLMTGKLSADLGGRIHDILTDEIKNGATPVWSGETYDPNDEDNPDRTFGVQILEYERVYFVEALEYDDVGYFLSKAKAKKFVFGNWTNVRETSA
jgi:hypothetical protein